MSFLDYLRRNYGLFEKHLVDELFKKEKLYFNFNTEKNILYNEREWISFYNLNEEFSQERMINFHDIFFAKELSTDLDFELLQKISSGYYLITDTFVKFGQKLAGEVIHNYASNKVKEKKIILKNIPFYERESIENVLKDKQGLSYLRAIAGDNSLTSNEILDKTIEFSKKDPEKILITTANRVSRKSYGFSSVKFREFSDFFWIACDMSYAPGKTIGVNLRK